MSRVAFPGPAIRTVNRGLGRCLQTAKPYAFLCDFAALPFDAAQGSEPVERREDLLVRNAAWGPGMPRAYVLTPCRIGRLQWQIAIASASAASSGWGGSRRPSSIRTISWTWLLCARPAPTTDFFTSAGEY